MEQRYQEAIKWLGMAADKGNTEAQYKLGKILVEEGLTLIEQSAEQGYDEAKEWLLECTENANSDVEFDRNIKIGYIVKFGRYPQNNGNTPEPIEWQVLKIENGRALVISKYALDGGKPYNKKWESITWESCTLRKWLNNEFLNEAFDVQEQNRILLANVLADRNPDWNTWQGNDTMDKIFLLSIKEADEFFKDRSDRICYKTKYVNKYSLELEVDWWLRSPGNDCKYAAYVYRDGFINTHGRSVNGAGLAIRPAFYLNLNS